MDLLKPRVSLVDAFTHTPGQGNRAGVVLEARSLDRATMLAIARSVAASETAFVVPAGDGADVRLRYFTPATEVDFCGHATVATFHRLAEEGRLAVPGTYGLRCEAGRLGVELERAGGATRVWIETPRHGWEDSPLEPRLVLELLGGEPRMLDPALPVRRSGPNLFLPIASREDVWRLAPRWDDLASAGIQHDLWGFLAFTRQTLEPDHVAHSRFFAPAKGIREDPVTGAANGPLGEYLALQGVLAMPVGGGKVRARAEQGDLLGKPGRVDLEVSSGPGGIERARVGGVAVTVFEGRVLAHEHPRPAGLA